MRDARLSMSNTRSLKQVTNLPNGVCVHVEESDNGFEMVSIDENEKIVV